MSNNLHIKLPTPIDYFGMVNSNEVFIKRDDLTDIAFGGNKARKIQYFIKDALSQKADCIVTYGSTQSNHCRITSAVASINNLDVYLIQPDSKDNKNYNGNTFLNSFFEPDVILTPLNAVGATIEQTLQNLKSNGKKPYFIQGGGHGNLGTHAYKLAYEEIMKQQQELKVEFDYIFHASGTGTTQAGLLAGKHINEKPVDIIGISIARKIDKGSKVIKDSLLSYLDSNNFSAPRNLDVHFIDEYIGNGYADVYSEIMHTIKEVARTSAIFLDPIYTGKAFYGMKQYINKNQLNDKKILFIHTGGTPILFNYAEDFKREFSNEHSSN